MKITVDKVKKHIINGYNKRTPVMLHGSPGCAKSSVVKQVAESLGLQLIDLRLPQLEPCDIRGIPSPNHKTKEADWYYPAFLPKEGKGILFLDEIDKSSVSVKNASLQLVLDRRIGDYHLPPGWSIVLAGNLATDGCFSQGLGSALSNRMLHYEIVTDLDVWLKWATANNINDEITGYLQFEPNELYSLQEGANAFPSPRSWEFLSNMLIGVEDKEEMYQLFEAAVGEATGQKYRAWYDVYKAVDVEAIVLKGKMPKAKDGAQEKRDFKYAVTIAVSHYVKKHFDQLPQYAHNILTFYKTLAPEVRLVFIKQFKPEEAHTMFKAKALTPDVARGLAEVLVGTNK